VLQLNHKRLVQLSGLETLVNLRKASFVDNEIDRISGLGTCRLLEELSLEGNNITHIEGIS
jgi:Leucine-rich repeat (LRR) protein